MTARSGGGCLASSGGGACAAQALLAASSAAHTDNWRYEVAERRIAVDASQSPEYFSNRQSPITNDSTIRDPQSSIVDSYLTDAPAARYGMVCGPCGRTHSVAPPPARSSACRTAFDTSSIGSKCAALTSAGARPLVFTSTCAFIWINA